MSRWPCKVNTTTDVVIVAISAAVGIATLILSRLRCRYVETTNEHGDRTQVSGCGFTDKLPPIQLFLPTRLRRIPYAVVLL